MNTFHLFVVEVIKNFFAQPMILYSYEGEVWMCSLRHLHFAAWTFHPDCWACTTFPRQMISLNLWENNWRVMIVRRTEVKHFFTSLPFPCLLFHQSTLGRIFSHKLKWHQASARSWITWSKRISLVLFQPQESTQLFGKLTSYLSCLPHASLCVLLSTKPLLFVLSKQV